MVGKGFIRRAHDGYQKVKKYFFVFFNSFKLVFKKLSSPDNFFIFYRFLYSYWFPTHIGYVYLHNNMNRIAACKSLSAILLGAAPPYLIS